MTQNTTLDNFSTGEFKQLNLTAAELEFLENCLCSEKNKMCKVCLALTAKEELAKPVIICIICKQPHKLRAPHLKICLPCTIQKLKNETDKKIKEQNL